ncbi:MAG: hypothetical protein R2867_46220 [Caldilineaceae bacterium]
MPRDPLSLAQDGASCLTAITGFSYIPLQLATYLGFGLAFISLLGIPLTIVLRLSGNEFFLGQATTLVSVLF